MGSCGGATKVWCKTIEHFMVYYHWKVHGEEGYVGWYITLSGKLSTVKLVCSTELSVFAKHGKSTITERLSSDH
eukprot:scaffold249353_cov82-Cyclotella_meneghiniana.AAC.11